MIRDPSDGSVKTNSVSGKPNSVSEPPIGLAALQAKYGPNWGLKSPVALSRKPAPAPTADELRAHYAKHNLGFQPKEQGNGNQTE